MFLEITKYIHKLANQKDAGITGSSQLFFSLFSLEIKAFKG